MATFSGKVTGGSLAFRSTPGGTAISGKSPINDGTALTVSTISGNTEWFSTTYSSTSGYVMSRWIAITSGGVKTGIVSTTSGSLNVRATPSASGTVSFTVAKDSTVQILEGPTSGFYRIGCSQGTGWASDVYITVGGTSTPPPSGGSYTAGHYGTLIKSGVNIRAAAKTSAATMGEFPSGCTFVIAGTETGGAVDGNTTWVKIYFGNASGSSLIKYVHSSCIQDDGTTDTSAKNRAIKIAKSLVGVSGSLLGLGGEWCQNFLFWLCGATGKALANMPYGKGVCGDARDWFKNSATATWRAYSSSYTPQAGDFVYYTGSGTASSHVDLIASGSSSSYTSYEGNLSNQVKKATGNVTNGSCDNSKTVQGYATPSWT